METFKLTINHLFLKLISKLKNDHHRNDLRDLIFKAYPTFSKSMNPMHPFKIQYKLSFYFIVLINLKWLATKLKIGFNFCDKLHLFSDEI